MGRRARPVRLHPVGRARLGRDAGRLGRPLPVRLERLGVREPRPAGRRGQSRGRARRPSGGQAHRRLLELRRAEGALRGGRRRRLRRAAGKRAARADRRRARSHRPLHVLAAPGRARRASRGPCAAGCPGAVHRREGPRYLDGRPLRAAGRRHLQRHASGPQLARDARDLPRGQRQRRDLRLGSGGGAERARGRRMDGAPALDLRSGLGRDARGGRLARGRGRAPRSAHSRRRCATRSTTPARSTASASRPSAKPSC